MENERVSLVVKVEYLDQTKEYNKRERGAFWQPLLQEQAERYALPNRPLKQTVTALETRFKQVFGRRIKQELTDYFSSNSQGGWAFRADAVNVGTAIPDQYASLLPHIGFNVKSIEYSSLDLGIEIAGAENLARLFEGNFDLFMFFAQAYLPLAFQTTLSLIDLPIQPMNFDITSVGALSQVFSAYSAMPATTSVPSKVTPSAPDRLQFVWLIANFSLLFPVLLSLLVVYVAAKNLSDERTALQENLKDLVARELAVAKAAGDRASDLEKLQLELVKLLRTPLPKDEKKK